MICDNCNSKETYVKEYICEYNVKGKFIKIKNKRRFCKKCNSLVYDSILDNEASKKAISKYNELFGINPSDIINLRKKYNLSQEQFSKIIGCAKKTLISYEKGKSIPNDIYLIVIKTLLDSPEVIVHMIDSNKEQFTNKEYDKISNKLNKIYDLENELSEYNGYNNLSIKKVYNMILFFSEHSIYKTKLLKEMFYADFLYYKNNCKSISGLVYTKLPFGPVPDQYETILNQEFIDNYIDYDLIINNEYECYNIKSKKEFDDSLFNEEEIKTLEYIKNKFKNYSVKDIVEYSHKEKAFIENKFNNKISYDYAFDIEI